MIGYKQYSGRKKIKSIIIKGKNLSVEIYEKNQVIQMKDQEKKKLYTGERSGVLVVSQGINNHLEIERKNLAYIRIMDTSKAGQFT